MNDREFDDLLRTADAPVPLPASFQQGVWNRIESRAVSDLPTGIAEFQARGPRHIGTWGAAAGIAAMMALGLWLGAVTAPEPKDAKLVYAESISPIARTHPK